MLDQFNKSQSGWVITPLIFLMMVFVTACGNQNEKEPKQDTSITEEPDLLDMRGRERVQADVTALTRSPELNEGDTFLITIDGMNLTFEVQLKRSFLDDVLSYAGTISGDATGSFSLSHTNEEFLGNIQLTELRRDFQVVYLRTESRNAVYEFTGEE